MFGLVWLNMHAVLYVIVSVLVLFIVDGGPKLKDEAFYVLHMFVD